MRDIDLQLLEQGRSLPVDPRPVERGDLHPLARHRFEPVGVFVVGEHHVLDGRERLVIERRQYTRQSGDILAEAAGDCNRVQRGVDAEAQ